MQLFSYFFPFDQRNLAERTDAVNVQLCHLCPNLPFVTAETIGDKHLIALPALLLPPVDLASDRNALVSKVVDTRVAAPPGGKVKSITETGAERCGFARAAFRAPCSSASGCPTDLSGRRG